MTTPSLKEQFDFAVEQVKTLPSNGDGPSDDEKLKMYALYKQATVGDCNTTRPGMFDFVGKSKWDAWNAQKGVSTEDAMTGYCNLYLDLSGRYQ